MAFRSRATWKKPVRRASGKTRKSTLNERYWVKSCLLPSARLRSTTNHVSSRAHRIPPAPFITSPPAVTAVSRFTSTRWPNSRAARSPARAAAVADGARWGQVLHIAYQVTSRGDRREPIHCDDDDRLAHLDAIAHAMDRFDAQVLAHCLMGNHYHLVLHTREANLSRLMRHVNGVYAQAFNRRHGLVREASGSVLAFVRPAHLCPLLAFRPPSRARLT